ncbi:single-stranded DNA-binding protein [Candidatus Dependentiae bacterium]|nr:MAG: single-stranded DNA-binding protein [Candidatus Dependentiae bacterium]
MAEGFNRVMLLGNLGADPDLRFTQGGQAVLNLRLATTESYLDKDKVRRERTDWHNVVIWGKRGEALAKIIGKGSSIFVEGSLRTSSYDDRDGNKRYKTEVIASNVVLAGRGRGGNGGADDGGSGPPPEDFSGGPRDDYGGSYGGRGGGGGGRGGYSQGGSYSGGGGGYSRGAAPPQAPPANQPHQPPADDFGYDGGDDIPF